MASGRFLSAAVSEDFRLNSLSIEAHLVFLMAIPHLDVDGIMPGHPTLVYAKACPLKTELLARMPDIISEWVDAGLVVRYECDSEDVLFFTGFSKNQRVRRDRETKSRFDLPPGWTREADGTPLRDSAGTPPGNCPATSGLKQSKVNTTNTTTASAGASQHNESGGGGGGGGGVPDSCDAHAAIQAWSDYDMPAPGKPGTITQLGNLIKQYGAKNVRAAIVIAGDNDKRTMGYVRGILKKGIDTPRNGTGPPTYTDATLIPDGDDDNE